MKAKADDRSDNVRKIQYNIDHTLNNINRDEEIIEETDDEKLKETLIAKNERRKETLEGLRSEIKDEACNRKDDRS